MGDGLKRSHPLTRRCCIDVIRDLYMSFASKYLLHQLFYGCRIGGGVLLMLIVICVRHSLVSN